MFSLGTKALKSLYPRSLENEDVIGPGNIKKPTAKLVRARRDSGGGIWWEKSRTAAGFFQV